MRITFLSKGVLTSGTANMRVLHPKGYLEALGYEVASAIVYRWIPKSTEVLVLHRVLADEFTLSLIRYLKYVGVYLIYDCDDLLFDEDGFEYLVRRGKKERDQSGLFRLAMQECDLITVSTPFLKSRADSFHPNVRVMRNALSQEYYLNSTIINSARSISRKDKYCVLAYLSGSETHEEDFALIEEQLLKLLSIRSHVKLLIVGHINIPKIFDTFGERFEKRAFIPYDEYVHVFREIDVNLIPLVAGEPFCEAKSELKYIEAGSAGVPSISSPTQTLIEVIDHKISGLISENHSWLDNMLYLADNPVVVKKLGEAARKDVIENYSPTARRSEWQVLMEGIQHQKTTESYPKISKLHEVILRSFHTCRVLIRWFRRKTKAVLSSA